MEKIIIDKTGCSMLLDFLAGERLRKIARMYFMLNMPISDISEDLHLKHNFVEQEVERITNIAKNRLKHRVCAQCGGVFYSAKSNVQLCDNCREENKKATVEHVKGVYKKAPKSTFPSYKVKSIHDIIKEMERYNRAHKTHLSYGQYISIMEK